MSIISSSLAQEAVTVNSKAVPVELFKVPEGFEVTLWAKSPMLRNPTNIDFDAQGRLWVVEGANYRDREFLPTQGDRIVVLEDRDGDGIAEHHQVFLQDPELAAPLGIAVLDTQIVVSQPPHLLAYTDTNGDGVFDPSVDKRQVVISGFNGRQHDHSLHATVAGPDGYWYLNQGNCGAQIQANDGKNYYFGSHFDHKPGTAQVADNLELAGKTSDDGNVWIGGFIARMRADGSRFQVFAHNLRNAYEHVVTSQGDVFQSDNDDPPACRVGEVMEFGNAGYNSLDGLRTWQADRRLGQSIPVAQWRQEDPDSMPPGDIYGGGSPTGVGFYENGALGAEWQGMLLACEAGRNVVFGYLPKRKGAGYELERFDFMTSNPEREFAGSDFVRDNHRKNTELKTWFRPTDVTVGPDGAIYVSDWFDGRVGGHTSTDSHGYGAIYRIAPKGFKAAMPKLNLDTLEGQLAALASPAVNVRYAGVQRLRAQGATILPHLEKFLEQQEDWVNWRALWVMAQLGDEGQQRVLTFLQHQDPTWRLIALRALRAADTDLSSYYETLSMDDNAAVRREVALAQRDRSWEQSRTVLFNLVERLDPTDRAYLAALGTAAHQKKSALFKALIVDKARVLSAEQSYALVWRLYPEEAVPWIEEKLQSSELSLAWKKSLMNALGFIGHQSAADLMLELAQQEDWAYPSEAFEWLMKNKSHLWSKHGLDEKLLARGLYDPKQLVLNEVKTPQLVNETQRIAVDQVTSLQGDIQRGQLAFAACMMCHKVADLGVEYGPNLTSFGQTQTRDVLIRSIVAPSHDIAHGFRGERLVLKDGRVIEGLILSSGDPVLIQSTGGLLQNVPQDRIQARQRLPYSLMPEPALLGLNPQQVADIVAYLMQNFSE